MSRNTIKRIIHSEDEDTQSWIREMGESVAVQAKSGVYGDAGKEDERAR